jgi:hypothetical protein
MNQQLCVKIQGQPIPFVVQKKTSEARKQISKRKFIKRSILILGIGIVVLYLIDGGTGIITAGVVEVVKWAHRNRETVDGFLQIASKKPF